MTTSFTMADLRENFAHCIQVLGGTTTASRRLAIDERAIRRFINGERPLTTGVLQDTAKALRRLISDATAAEALIVNGSDPAPDDLQLNPFEQQGTAS